MKEESTKKNKKIYDFFKHVISRFILGLSWCHDNLFKVALYIFVFVVFVIYNDFWINCIDRFWVDPIMSHIINNEWIVILSGTIVLFIHYYDCFKYKRIIDNKQLLFCIMPFILFVFVYVWCYCSDNWNYSLLFNLKWLPYTHLVFLPILIEIFLILYVKIKRKNNNDKDYLSLEIEKTNDVKDSYKRSAVIQSTFENIRNCFYEEGSFNIGITGSWGSGKTTFIKELYKLYRNSSNNKNTTVIWFEPWKNDSPDSIVKSFFNTLKDELKKYIPGFSSTIDDYILLLIDETEKKSIKTIFNVIKKIKNDNNDIYNEISESLKTIKHKTIVFIDDIDRLDTDEINSVLRIVRNTANFPYIQFIVAFDKEYVISCINKNETKLFNAYLDKFFNIEITLPKFEDRIICHELYCRISEEIYNVFNMNDKKSGMNRIYRMIYIKPENFNGEIIVDNYLIPMVLTTMRDVIRFYNSFKTTLQFYKSQNIEKEIYLESLFFIELLRYKYNDVYMIIRNNYDLILEKVFDYYTFNKENEKYKILRSNLLKHYTETEINVIEHIITLLFGISPDNNSIKKDRNFDKYFMFRLDEAILTVSQFESLMELDENTLVNKANEMYREKYTGEFKIIIERLLRKLQSLDEYKQNNPPRYDKLYNTLSILSKNNNSYLKSDVFYAMSAHLYDLSSFDINHFSAKLNLLNSMDSTMIEVEEFDFLGLMRKILNKDELRRWVYKGLNGKEEDIIYQFLSTTKHIHRISPILTDIIDNIDDDKLILSKSVLSDIRLSYFLNYDDKTSSAGMLLFQNCIDHNDKDTNTIYIQDKALESMRDAITNNPEKYFTNFVTYKDNLIMDTYDPEQFYIQIFGNNNNFEEFLNNCSIGSPNEEKVKNYWMLYKYNGYSSIDFREKGNGQDKIKNCFRNEILLLNELLDIRKNIIENGGITDEDFNKLSNNKLDIKLKSDIYLMIKKFIV